jgi:tRNA (guanine-N7-)-methyltransferase
MLDLINTWQIHQIPGVDGKAPAELDMGCGKGRFTVELARRYPERTILANDVLGDRLRCVQRRGVVAGCKNLTVLRAVHLPLVSFQLPPQSLDRVHLLCPDPWPKKRHTIRRLVCTDFLCRMRRILKPGGIFHLATDYGPYYEDWLRMFAALDFYEPCPEGIADVADIKTDFELRWNAEGKEVQHIAFKLVK